MSIAVLALVLAVALLGPLLALPRKWRLPVLAGEITAGLIVGNTGVQLLDPSDGSFTLLADIGFALVMFVAGSEVPVRRGLKDALATSIIRVTLVAVAATALAVGISAAFDLPRWGLYAVLLASSSAAIALPAINELGLAGGHITTVLPQIAIADTLCIILLPAVMQPEGVGATIRGTAIILVVAAAVIAILWWAEKRGYRHTIHEFSETHRWALELRIMLIVLLGLSALAISLGVSVMLAGFLGGLGLAVIGNPRRLAHQLFAVTEGFFAPVFFVWLGARLDMRELVTHPVMIGLGVTLGLAAVLAHLVPRLHGQPLTIGMLSAAQMGLPVAAVQIGLANGIFAPGEAAAILLGAVITLVVAIRASGRLARISRVDAA